MVKVNSACSPGVDDLEGGHRQSGAAQEAEAVQRPPQRLPVHGGEAAVLELKGRHHYRSWVVPRNLPEAANGEHQVLKRVPRVLLCHSTGLHAWVAKPSVEHRLLTNNFGPPTWLPPPAEFAPRKTLTMRWDRWLLRQCPSACAEGSCLSAPAPADRAVAAKMEVFSVAVITANEDGMARHQDQVLKACQGRCPDGWQISSVEVLSPKPVRPHQMNGGCHAHEQK
eukprot:CAMPEP_0206149992 /NCGR_PEP_ID=MMETSP1473-20131121/38070_1 /ASSEMBLY_ACC=CAM_ASM_001109 /TAXON_ID=1461547 /ORGANISM="Stichococcus sp, Strain RCC1054" /LENGTH=224 /DNA_ID=CAMNT_0053547479 /DNA_START=816 /DNA_END=1491 /DNA_ORIENTATION=+